MLTKLTIASAETLVSLITVEAQSYGPNSLVGIKVVEYCPPPHLTTGASTSSTAIAPGGPPAVEGATGAVGPPTGGGGAATQGQQPPNTGQPPGTQTQKSGFSCLPCIFMNSL